MPGQSGKGRVDGGDHADLCPTPNAYMVGNSRSQNPVETDTVWAQLNMPWGMTNVALRTRAEPNHEDENNVCLYFNPIVI